MADFNANVNGAGMSGFLRVTEATSESTNESTVTAIFYVSKNAGTGTTYGTLDMGVITINGNTDTFTGQSVSVPNSGVTNQEINRHEVTVAHNADGSKSIVVSANVYIGPPSSWTTGATGNQNFGLTDFVRPPLAPTSAPTVSRVGTGETIAITSFAATPRTPATTATTGYNYRYSTTSTTGPWTGPVAMTNSTSIATDLTGTTPTSVYWIQTQAVNSEGAGVWSSSSSAYAAPSITSLTSVGTTATITVAAASSNGGSTVSSHVIEYSTASDFASIAGTQTISGAAGGTTNITGLLPGTTYYFRAYATNSVSINSPYSTSQSTFIAAYGRRYQSQNISSASSTTTVATYNSTAHGFSVGDQVTTSGLTPSNLNVTGSVATASADAFTINGTFTSGTWTTTGTAAGWALMLTGKRYASDDGSGNPGWVAITTAKKYTAGAFTSLSSPAS